MKQCCYGGVGVVVVGRCAWQRQSQGQRFRKRGEIVKMKMSGSGGNDMAGNAGKIQ